MFHIRAVQETDDFEMIYHLIDATMKRFSGDAIIVYGVSSESLKRQYCYSESHNKGFIAINDNKIVSFMGVYTAKVTKYAYLECGFLQEFEDALVELLHQCVHAVAENGGTKIFNHSPIMFGQVRNEGISFWERLGFISEEYSYITTELNLDSWEEPNSFDSSGIEPAMEMGYEEIKQILLEDGEDSMAELFQKQYSPDQSLNQVILTLKDKATNEISAIANYRVKLQEIDKETTALYASAFSIHVRPQFTLDRYEIRRFVQGALISMKQLNIESVISRITLKNFDVFAAMVTEGFHNQGMEKVNTIRLFKEI
ncbi:hypothetical protein J14TS2_28760 [Bacillus sp. J14TS2]|uniref:hypothetical protein n=1 Tax=Bacillus sp. J14TS2 TaxID=2807188 RepID=UPI001B1287FA|nr:hypothetical protein [Bacillus sp. J14TS2]GIN72401.1 hypothetical protein J14TS2_28760 [Bacillus sp. J14TS2]